MKIFCNVLALLITIALGVLFEYACAIYGSIGNLYWDIALGLVLIVVGSCLAEVFHELGHVAFGACAKIKAKPRFCKFLTSSSCRIVPKTDKNLKPKIIITAAGGLIVNFLFIVLGIIALTVKAVPVELACLTPFSFYLFMINAVPFEYASGKTDGLVISELAKNTDNAKVLLAVLTVQAQVLNGKPIEEVDEKLLSGLPQIQEDDPAFISLTELRYEYFKAKGEEEKAEFWKTRFEELKQNYT